MQVCGQFAFVQRRGRCSRVVFHVGHDQRLISIISMYMMLADTISSRERDRELSRIYILYI